MKIVEFKEFFNLMKPILNGRANANLVRELVSMITSLDTDIDPSESQKDNTLRAYANGSRELSDDYARSIIEWLDYRKFVESFINRDDAIISRVAVDISSIDASITPEHVVEIV